MPKSSQFRPHSPPHTRRFRKWRKIHFVLIWNVNSNLWRGPFSSFSFSSLLVNVEWKLSKRSLIKLHFYACDPLLRRLAHLIWRGPFWLQTVNFFRHPQCLLGFQILQKSTHTTNHFYAGDKSKETCEKAVHIWIIACASQWTRQPKFARLRFLVVCLSSSSSLTVLAINRFSWAFVRIAFCLKLIVARRKP